jgi:asparagine synthase (glutamine-hydrolysing)
MSQVSLPSSARRALWGGELPSESVEPTLPVPPPDHSVTGLNRAFHFDLTCYLPGDVLTKVDRAAMAHGLETRAPFLDRDLAEFVLRIPAGMKVSNDDLKVILRESCGDLWPPSVSGRGKQGFGAPYARWLARPDVTRIATRVFADSGPLRALLPGLSRSVQPRNFRTWTLLTLGLWLERHDYAW